MKKVVIFISVVVVIVSTFVFRYDLIELAKRNLKDHLTVKVDSRLSEPLILIVRSEDDTIAVLPIKETDISLPRHYGKNLFYIQSSNGSKYLDVSYYKFDVWSSSSISLQIRMVRDSVIILWSRDYDSRIESGNQTIVWEEDFSDDPE